VPGIPYKNAMMKMMMMPKLGDLQIIAIASYDRGLIFFTLKNADYGWRKLHSEEFHDVCSSPNIICRTK